jgi:hypothetical protein
VELGGDDSPIQTAGFHHPATRSGKGVREPKKLALEKYLSICLLVSRILLHASLAGS